MIPNRGVFNAIWRYFQPAIPPNLIEERLKALLLMALVGLMIGLGVPLIILYWVANPQYFRLQSADFWVNVFFLAGLWPAFHYARTQHYRKVAWAVIVALILAIYFLAMPYGDAAYPGAFNYMLLPIVLMAFFVNLRWAFGLVLVNLVGMIAMGTLYQELSDGTTSPGFLVIIGGAMVMILYYQEVIFRRQQAKVEEQKQTQFQLHLEQERVAILNNVVMEITHDLKSPLNILNNKFYLIGKGALDERQRNHLQGAQVQVNRITDMINQLITLVKLDTTPQLDLQPLDPLLLLQGAHAMFVSLAAEKQITLEADLPDHLPQIMGDHQSLERVLVNLLGNALHYTPAEKSVKIIARTLPDHAQLEVLIQDTGMGIPAEDVPRIFERFYRSERNRQYHQTGSGLGLTIVQKLVALHSGSVTVESQEGVGTTFRLKFPTLP